MKKYSNKKEVLDEINHLEEKARHSKSFSDDENYPKSSRDRFLKKYNEYNSSIEELNKKLKELESKPNKKELPEFLDENDTDVDEDYSATQALKPDVSEFQETVSIDDEDDEDEMGESFREEIDFSDSRKALDVFNSLYPEGLDE